MPMTDEQREAFVKKLEARMATVEMENKQRRRNRKRRPTITGSGSGMLGLMRALDRMEAKHSDEPGVRDDDEEDMEEFT